MYFNNIYLGILLVGCFFATSANAMRLSVSPVLQRKMVIQQNKPFKVWGQTKGGEVVRVTADWLSTEVSVTADKSGHFLAMLDVPPVKEGDFSNHELEVRSAGQTIVLDSLLIGDVWFCSGQSNMQFAIKEDKQAAEALSQADRPHLRLFNTGLNFSDQPLDTVAGKWTSCTPEMAKDFSAVAYYMAQELQDSLHYPIGVIFSGIGASAAQAYVPQEVLARDSILCATYLTPYLASPKSKEKIDGGFSFEKVTRPYLLYNAMIHPFRNLSIKGICWYQGEANHLERAIYTRLTQRLIQSWREVFKQDELPFYYIQIAPFFHDKEDPKLAFDAFFREAQERVAELNNTQMIVSMDVGEAKDLHPKNKRPLGQRLAATALNRTYGRLDIPYQGPKVLYVQYEEHKATVYFAKETIPAGLTTNDGKEPAFFALAGEDKTFHLAKAKIRGDTIELFADGVIHPVAVRYAFFNYPVTNLQNGFGFPALPFRTDHWPEPLIK
jgi:sialate O-acetylesterase